MNAREHTEAFLAAIEAADWDTARSFLADGFQFTGTMLPAPLGIQEWLGLSMALRAGVPDLSFNFTIHEIDEEAVDALDQYADVDGDGYGDESKSWWLAWICRRFT